MARKLHCKYFVSCQRISKIRNDKGIKLEMQAFRIAFAEKGKRTDKHQLTSLN